jgi:hypothetical protein
MSLFHINRQTATALGNGLPFMTELKYQMRNAEVETTEKVGYWQVPQNFLPTFQVWSDFDLTAIYIVPVVNGVDGTPILLPLTEVTKTCTVEGKKIYFTTNDTELTYLIPCGFWYFKLVFGANPPLFSEVWFVNGVCNSNYFLSYEVLNVQMDLSMNVLFTINFVGVPAIAAYINAVGATSYFTRTFTGNLPDGATNVAIAIETLYCGTFAQSYTFQNNGGITSTLTPIY